MLLSSCKELNWFDHYEALECLKLRKIKQIIKDRNINDYSTIKIELTNNCIAIIHKSTKRDAIIQVSYFDNNGAYADKEVNSIKEALCMFSSYNKMEVI